jgi:hypothetical protein
MATRRSRYSGAATQDRNELGAVLVAAGLARHPSMAFLLKLNGCGHRILLVPTSRSWAWSAGRQDHRSSPDRQ